MTADRRSTGLELQLFGGPRVVGPVGLIHLSPMQLALLTLVYAESGVSRPRAGWILWRRDDTSAVRQSIRQLLLLINRRLGLKAIETDGDALGPSAEMRCDVVEFRKALEVNSLLAAATLLDSGFAPIALPSVGREYEDWSASFGTTLTRKLRDKALAKWEEASYEGAWRDGRDAAECLYLLSPNDVRVVERVVEARARDGKLGSAEAAYATYLESLPFGEAPPQGLDAAMDRVRLLQANDEKTGATDDSPPFVGRVDALAEGCKAFDRVEAGGFSCLLVSGESGIGKTRLLQELEREAVLRDFRCLRARPVELERTIPLNPLLDALSGVNLRPHLEALGKPWSAVISSELPAGSYDELVGELPPIQDSSLPRRLLDAFSLLLERLAVEQPTVFFLDDLQWADATTVAALQFFQRRWTEGSFGIVASVRPDLLSDVDPASNYLSDGKDLEVRRIELGELSREEAVSLIEGIMGGPIDAEAIERLCALAGLHPLYLTELTRDFLVGQLKFPNLPADEVMIPVSLQQILRSRITNLSDRAMRVARILAVGARPMRLGVVAALSGISLDDCADCAEELQRWRLVEVKSDTLQISHDLFRSALYNHMSEPRKALVHRALAEHLLRDSTNVPPGELAIHFSRAGDTELAAQYGWIAASRAWDSGAMAAAAHFYELVTENETDSIRRAHATGSLARSLHLNRDIVRANPLLELAASRLREAGDPEQARRMEIRRVEGLTAVGATPVAGSVERLESIKSEARDASDWEAVALALDVQLHLFNRCGNIAGIQAVFGEMRQTAHRGSSAATVLCYAGLAMEALFGNPETALASARKGVAIASDEGEHRLTALVRLLVVMQCRGMLLLPEADGVIQEARTLAQRSGDLRVRFSIESNIALSLLDAGEIERADVMMTLSSRMLGSADMDMNRFNQANNRAELALARHDFGGAASWYAKATTYVGLNTPAYAQELLNAGLGLCALETGDLSESRRREQQLAEPPETWFYDPTTIFSEPDCLRGEASGQQRSRCFRRVSRICENAWYSHG